MTHVFIVGSKGIPAAYGGFETFAEQLVRGRKSEEIYYHVSCMDNEEKEFEYLGAHCFGVRLPLQGAPGRIAHMGLVMDRILKWKKEHPDENTIVYILGCRIGPLLYSYRRKLKKHNILIYCNPDGLEWKRSKWNAAAKKFLKVCEAALVKNSDLAICDSKAIEEYISETYPDTRTTYIAYGASVRTGTFSAETNEKFREWCEKNRTKPGEYYLIVGRFVPENNYEAMIRGFLNSTTKRKLVIISNVENNKFYATLKEAINMNDDRVCFAGTVYDQELLMKIREEAFAYLHGHEVGGTNPSLLEALASTKLNILLNVPFNREVGRDGALYFRKNNLHNIIEYAEGLEEEEVQKMSETAKDIVRSYYNWPDICKSYEEVFIYE